MPSSLTSKALLGSREKIPDHTRIAPVAPYRPVGLFWSLPTQTTENRFAFCEPFLTKYYGSAKSAQSVREPLDTVTTKERFALVQPQTDGYQMDILFRMLQPHELASAMGFDDYEFSGNKTEKVRQIGNAVPVHLAKALCKAILAA